MLLHELQHAVQQIESFASGASTRNPDYNKVAGEIEARDTEARSSFTAEQRKNTRPDIDRTDVVFADSNASYSIVDGFTDENGKYYSTAVLLDTDFFDGLSPRNWGKKLRQYVEDRSENDPFIMEIEDENGNTQKLQFAKMQDRSEKNGNNHPALSELYRTSDNISKLAVIHIDEIAEISEESNPYYTDEVSHGWLDAQGWLHRNAYVINAKNGAIYSLTLDIAKASDGRTILYATKGKIKRAGNVAVNSLKIRGSRQNFNSENNVSHKEQTVNDKYSADDATAAAEYFGTTYNINEAGYLLTNGKLLDLSGRRDGAPGGYRTVDHRDITDAFESDYGAEIDDYSGGMIKFLRQGNIRLSPESGGINLMAMPNKAQQSALDRYISKFRGEVILDIDDEKGNTVASVEYPKYTHSSVVIKDIQDYFEKGKIPESFDKYPAYETRYSIDDNLEYMLYDVYNNEFDSAKGEVYIGTSSNFITKVIGAKPFDVYMPANKAYQAMATEGKAISDGRPTGESINYHGLGVKGLMDILRSSEEPIAAYADTPSKDNKRENRIVLVTDQKLDGGLGVVIEELETTALKDGKRIKANKAITAYPKSNIKNAIADAIADGRILYIDKKRSHMLRSGVKGANYPTAISEDDFTNNIRRFWENVKWKNSGRVSYTAEASSETEPEWKTRLRQFSEDKYSADDTERITEEEAHRRIFQFPPLREGRLERISVLC